MMMQPSLAARLHASAESNEADFFTAGFPATVPDGHGTEYGTAVPALTKGKDAQAFGDARIAGGSNYIQLMYGDSRGDRGRFQIPPVTRRTMAAVLSEAADRVQHASR